MIFKGIKWKITDKIFDSKMRRQRKRRGYADIDCWNLFNWFQSTFVEMIKHLRNRKMGAPELDFEEVDNFPLEWIEQQCKILLKQKKRNGYEEEVKLFGSERYFDRWWLVLSRIAYCLEESDEEKCSEKNEFYEEYFEQVWGSKEELRKMKFKEIWDTFWKPETFDENGKTLTYRLETKEPDPKLQKKYYKREEEIAEYREKMKNEAMDLLKKYFFCLWD